MREREIPKYEPQQYWQPETVIQFYEEHDKPLSRSAIDYHLTNLIGTSFLRPAVEGITRKYNLGRNHPYYNFMQTLTHPHSFLYALNGMETIRYFTGEVEEPEQRSQAIATLQTALHTDFTPTHVYEYQTLEPDEMRVELRRTDDIWTDEKRLTSAYRHLATSQLPQRDSGTPS